MKSQDLKNTILHNLERFEVNSLTTNTTLTSAAVALVVEPGSQCETPCIYLTLRSGRLRKHAGQFALPGGKLDAGESAEQAARRELREELGITLDADAEMGRLDDFATRSGFVITPVVLWKDNNEEPVPNEAEVARFYRVPFSDLIDNDLADKPRAADNTVFSIAPDSIGTSIYSPTAAIIFQFREAVLLGRTTRVSHYEQPEFAWR